MIYLREKETGYGVRVTERELRLRHAMMVAYKKMPGFSKGEKEREDGPESVLLEALGEVPSDDARGYVVCVIDNEGLRMHQRVEAFSVLQAVSAWLNDAYPDPRDYDAERMLYQGNPVVAVPLLGGEHEQHNGS